MSKTGSNRFFTRKTFGFLRELADNNERDWFNVNKHRYESLVLDPALGFIEAMAPAIARLSTHIVAIPKRQGGSLMRVYRDTRFSRDKTPYKTNVGIQFRHELGKDVHAPGFYLHLEPRQCFLAAGIWHPDAESLAKVRARIVDEPAAWKRAAHGKRFTDAFELQGSSLSRPPKGIAADAPHLDDLKRKDFIGVSPIRETDATSADFIRLCGERFGRAQALMRFLCAALDVGY